MEALFETGWIEKKDDDIFIHDWNTWQKEWQKARDRREYDKNRKKGDTKSGASYEDEVDPEGENPDTPAEPEKKKYSTKFEELWEHYPRKIEKADTYAKYNARIKDGWSHEQLLEATKNYAYQCQRKGTSTEYIKHGKTFFGPNTPFVDFLPNKGSLKSDDAVSKGNPFAKYKEDE